MMNEQKKKLQKFSFLWNLWIFTWKTEEGHIPTFTALSRITCSALLSLGYHETQADMGVIDQIRTCCGAIGASKLIYLGKKVFFFNLN